MILGERIRLRHIEKEDLPRYVAWLNDPEVRHGLSHYLPMSQVREERWFEQMLQKPVYEHPFAVEGYTGGMWQLIGSTALFDFDHIARSAELGIFIGEKDYWGQGFGSEAMLLVLKHGFETLNLNRIFLRVYEFNQRAIKLYEKLGFVPEGRMRQVDYIDGKYVDMLCMSMLRDEWDEKHA